MDDLRRLAVFAEVARQGSLTAAARALGISPSAVSQQLRALEAEHRIRLVNRTTRKLTLTDTGSRFAEHCRAMLDAATRAREHLKSARQMPDGELRITAPLGFARFIGPAMAPMLAAHPGLTLSLHCGDNLIDLVEARIDLAIRIGTLPDSDWVAEPLLRLERCIGAAPAYLAQAGIPATPTELSGRPWIGLGAVGSVQQIELRNHAGATATVSAPQRIAVNSMQSMRELCAAGLGLAALVREEARDELNSGRIVPLLGGWRLEALQVWAVTPGRERRPARVGRAIAALRELVRAVSGNNNVS